MPPRIPAIRGVWTSSHIASTSSTSSTASTPSTAANALSSARPFSSSPAVLALGPQSPNYIDVPKPLQPTFPLEPRVKGHLPIPRDIFKTRNPQPKSSPAFLDKTTRSPKTQKTPGPYSRDAEYRLYKQRLADARRQALQAGVHELHERKLTTEAQYLAKIQASGAFRRELATAPPRDVDVLTATSLSKGVRDFLADALPASSRTASTPKRREAYQRRVARVQNVRSTRLHDLYVNAREFIVDEQQLDDAIEKAFGSEEAPIGWDVKGNMGPRSEGKEGLSPWHGPMPEGVGDRLQKLKGGEGVGLAKERVKRVAEELTGGKM